MELVSSLPKHSRVWPSGVVEANTKERISSVIWEDRSILDRETKRYHRK